MEIKVRKDSNTPLYKQIIDAVISGIQSGEFKEGSILPSINELADRLEVSRETTKKHIPS